MCTSIDQGIDAWMLSFRMQFTQFGASFTDKPTTHPSLMSVADSVYIGL